MAMSEVVKWSMTSLLTITADNSITRVAHTACTLEAANGVCTVSVDMAIISTISTLVDI